MTTPNTTTSAARDAGHTPGPWHVGYATDGELPKGALLVAGLSEYQQEGLSHEGNIICAVAPPDRTTATDEANARLIAAAPDLLRIAKMLETWRDAGSDSVSFSTLMPEGGDDDETLADALEAVLARAEGRESCPHITE